MNRIDELEAILANANVDPDAFMDWLEHPITKRFKQEVELQLLHELYDTSASYKVTCEEIALASVRSAAICDELSNILEWKPAELKVD